MAFTYQAYQNPYADNITNLMLRQGDIAAQGALNKGAAIAGAVTGATSDVASGIAQANDPKRQIEQAQLSELQRQQQGRQVLGSAVNKYTTLDPTTGKATTDHEAVANEVSAAGFPEQGNAWLKVNTENAEALGKLRDSARAYQESQLGAAGDLLSRADSPETAHAGLLTAAQYGLVDEKTAKDIQAQMDAAGPDGYQGIQAKMRLFSPAYQKDQEDKKKLTVVPEGGTVINGTGQTVATGQAKPKTEAEIALAAAGGDPNLAMHMLKPDTNAKPGTVEDWVSRARRMAVGNNNGQPLTDAQLQDVDTKAMQQFRETNADPELRAASLAQKNIAASLAQLQLNQAPTHDQAISVAQDLVNHRIAPEQMATLFSTRGREGLAFKLDVATEAKKIDPNFNFEQASSEYNLVKSPGFQNTVRYMDSVTADMSQLQKNANALDNGSVRSINDLVNKGKDQFNNVNLAKFNTDRVLVGDGVAKILAGGGTGNATSDAKLNQAMGLIRTSDDPHVIAGTIGEIQTLLGNRRTALTRGTYMENGGTPAPGAPQGGGVTVTSPSGKTYTFKSQAEADTAVAKAKAAGLWQ